MEPPLARIALHAVSDGGCWRRGGPPPSSHRCALPPCSAARVGSQVVAEPRTQPTSTARVEINSATRVLHQTLPVHSNLGFTTDRPWRVEAEATSCLHHPPIAAPVLPSHRSSPSSGATVSASTRPLTRQCSSACTLLFLHRSRPACLHLPSPLAQCSRRATLSVARGAIVPLAHQAPCALSTSPHQGEN